MGYCTRADVEALYGKELVIRLTEQDDDYENDTDARMQAAIDSASAEIDSYLLANYALPLTFTSTQLLSCCRDIAVYRIAIDAGPRTDEMKVRYDGWIKWLTLLAAGKVNLVKPVPVVDPNAPPDPGNTGGDGNPLPARGFNAVRTVRG